MGQHPAHAALGDLQDIRHHRAAAAHLGQDRDHILARGGGGRGAVLGAGREHEADRRAEHFHQVIDLLAFLRRAALPAHHGRQIVQRGAAGMQIDQIVAIGQQHRFDVMRDDRRRRAIGVAGERAVEVALVDRRGAQPGMRGGIVRHRQDDDAALDVLGLERAGQFRQRHLAFVLVAMIARHQQHARTVAILDADHRDRQPAIGGAVHRMGQPQEAGLLAVLGKIERGRDTAGPCGCTGCHGGFFQPPGNREII